MTYPCNRCGRPIASKMNVCNSCIEEIDEDSERYARETMREAELIRAERERQDRAPSRSQGAGCALLVIATAALPLALDAMRWL